MKTTNVMLKLDTPFQSLLALLILTLSAGAAAQQTNTDGSQQSAITVNEKIFRMDWNDVPFDTRYFTYTPEQIKRHWKDLMVGLRAPYPSTELIKYIIDHYPGLLRGVDPYLIQHPAELQDRIVHVWQLFFAGKFQKARELGLKLGPLGMMPGGFSQTIYAIYLAKRKSVKDMLLQDVINTVNSYEDIIDRMKDSEREAIQKLAAFAILGKAYAMARIAVEAPIAVAVARGYIRKIKRMAHEVLELVPNHPLGHAFLGGVNAGIIRRVGKFAGRMTYGARASVVADAFEKALELAPGYAITHYEYANALIYMHRKRELNRAMKHLEKATRLDPQFAMEALDSMYAWKRLQEVRLYALYYRSFREFEQDRFHFMRVTNRNLYCVLLSPLTMDKLKHPKKYVLPDL